MKAHSPAFESCGVPATEGSVWSYVELAKPRISMLAAAAAACGYYLAAPESVGWAGLLHTSLATMVLSGGACAWNEYLEADVDALMRRTAQRPLPAHRVAPSHALTLAAALTLLGLAYLVAAANVAAALVGLLSLLIYVFVYTPLKRRTSTCTLVGGVSGALPPVIGWLAASGRVDFGAAVLFAIMYLWQLPHFLAIAWVYQEDYRSANMPMLPLALPDRRTTPRQAFIQSVALLFVSLLPTVAEMAGHVYAIGAAIAGLAFTSVTWRWYRRPNTAGARNVFFGSLIYICVLFALFFIDRLLP